MTRKAGQITPGRRPAKPFPKGNKLGRKFKPGASGNPSGMPKSRAQAQQLAIGTFVGASALAAGSDESPEVLRARVTSKGGTTYAALTVMERSGLSQHFTALADHASRPIVLYNIPYRSAVTLETETLLELADHPNIIGMKDCGANRAQSIELLRRRPAGFRFGWPASRSGAAPTAASR